MERDCESELSKLNIEQNACIYHFGASVIHGQRSNILRLRMIEFLRSKGYTVLNLIEIRKPYKDEKISTTIKVDKHTFDY